MCVIVAGIYLKKRVITGTSSYLKQRIVSDWSFYGGLIILCSDNSYLYKSQFAATFILLIVNIPQNTARAAETWYKYYSTSRGRCRYFLSLPG